MAPAQVDEAEVEVGENSIQEGDVPPTLPTGNPRGLRRALSSWPRGRRRRLLNRSIGGDPSDGNGLAPLLGPPSPSNASTRSCLSRAFFRRMSCPPLLALLSLQHFPRSMVSGFLAEREILPCRYLLSSPLWFEPSSGPSSYLSP